MKRIVLAMALGLAACTARVEPAPSAPPLPAESRPLPPVSEAPLVWRPGDWAFAGGSYRYDAGQYVAEAGTGRAWQFAHWGGRARRLPLGAGPLGAVARRG